MALLVSLKTRQAISSKRILVKPLQVPIEKMLWIRALSCELLTLKFSPNNDEGGQFF